MLCWDSCWDVCYTLSHTHSPSIKLNVTLWRQLPSKLNSSSHHEQIMICGELRHTSCLMELNRLEESHSHLPVRDIRIHGETDWTKGNGGKRGGKRDVRRRSTGMCQMLHESLNASCSNWLYWVHQRPPWWGPNASHCMWVCLAPNTQNNRDQRIASVRTLYHEVILSVPLRLGSVYANVWRSSGLLCKRSAIFYSNSWKADNGVEQTFKVNTKDPRSGLSQRTSRTQESTFIFMQNNLSISRHKYWEAHTKPHTHYVVYTHTPLTHKEKEHKNTTKKVNWGRKNSFRFNCSD